MATVTFEGVNKFYGDFQAVKDLDLEGVPRYRE